MKCRYCNGGESPACCILHPWQNCLFLEKYPLYIYSGLKYLNHWANCLYIQNLTVTKNASLKCASNLSPPLCSSHAAALAASWNNDWEECYRAQQAHGKSGAFSYRACGQILLFLLSIRSILVYDQVLLGLWRWLSVGISQYLNSPCEK